MKNRFSNADDYVSKLGHSTFLYENIWEENTTALLHAPRGAGKTAKALDIAVSLTVDGSEVFFLTTGRIRESLTPKIAGNKKLYVHTPTFESPDDKTDYADLVLADLEDAIAETDARIFIIDSISRIAALSFGRNASPAYIMKRLVALQVRHQISLLVVARDNTRASDRALINLAESEITLDEPASQPAVSTPAETATNETQPQNPLTKEPVCHKEPTRISCPPIIFTPAKPRKQLTRRERRLLRRKTQTRQHQ